MPWRRRRLLAGALALLACLPRLVSCRAVPPQEQANAALDLVLTQPPLTPGRVAFWGDPALTGWATADSPAWVIAGRLAPPPWPVALKVWLDDNGWRFQGWALPDDRGRFVLACPEVGPGRPARELRIEAVDLDRQVICGSWRFRFQPTTAAGVAALWRAYGNGSPARAPAHE